MIKTTRMSCFISLWLGVVSCAIAMNLHCLAADDRVKVDNAFARVLVVNSPAGDISALHEHKMNRVMVYLDAGEMSLTDASASGELLKFKAGEALWSPVTLRPHVSMN